MMKSQVMVVATLLMSLLLQFAPAHSASYTVGDSTGWRFGVAGWENGKKFKASDTLVFSYNPRFHNVVKVDRVAYHACKVPKNAPTFSSGDDRLVLSRGANYFICGIPGHCGAGMKIAVFAA